MLAAGADLNELVNISTAEAFRRGWLKDLNDALDSFRKPIIAAVRGFAVSVPYGFTGEATNKSLVRRRIRAGIAGNTSPRIPRC
jgi:hypothetical protein